MYKAIKNDDVEKMDGLINNGVDINANMKIGKRCTPLEASIEFDAVRCFNRLLLIDVYTEDLSFVMAVDKAIKGNQKIF